MCPRFLVGDRLGQTTPPCSGPSCHPITPSLSHPVGWMLPFRQAWLGCRLLPCQSGGLQPARLLGTHLLLPPTRSLWQAGKLQVWCCFPCRRALTYPPGWGALAQEVSGVQDNGWEHSLISTWRLHREQNGDDNQAFQTSLAEPPSPPATVSERTRKSWVIFCSFSSLCSELLSTTIPYLLI